MTCSEKRMFAETRRPRCEAPDSLGFQRIGAVDSGEDYWDSQR